MKKLSVIVAIILVMALSATSVYAYDVIGLSNFEKNEIYNNAVFSDVGSQSWYYENVKVIYEYGLMNGRGSHLFAPNSQITLAETIVLAARINHIYYNASLLQFDSTDPGDTWYGSYVSYAEEAGILQREYRNYSNVATRAQFAEILSKSVDPIEFEEINWVDDGAIPDVPMNNNYADSVYMLYRAGILTGSDKAGHFNPDSTITRAEAAAIITRIVDPSLRKPIELMGNY